MFTKLLNEYHVFGPSHLLIGTSKKVIFFKSLVCAFLFTCNCSADTLLGAHYVEGESVDHCMEIEAARLKPHYKIKRNILISCSYRVQEDKNHFLKRVPPVNENAIQSYEIAETDCILSIERANNQGYISGGTSAVISKNWITVRKQDGELISYTRSYEEGTPKGIVFSEYGSHIHESIAVSLSPDKTGLVIDEFTEACCYESDPIYLPLTETAKTKTGIRLYADSVIDDAHGYYLWEIRFLHGWIGGVPIIIYDRYELSEKKSFKQ